MQNTRTVLVVDDMAMFRDLVTAALRQVGYRAIGASNGEDATRIVKNGRPDLILLDVAMPGMDGLTFLENLRKNEETADTPVILLTATADKHCVLKASKLRARDYLLKSAFSLDELLARVQKHAPLPTASAGEALSAPAADVAESVAQSVPKERPRMSRKDCIRRAMEAMPARTLGGVVAEILTVASSPRGDLSHMAAMISQDMTLSARVLQAANSAAYASAHGAVTSIHDAVWTIGSSAVRNIAVSLGIYEAMPKNSPDGFNPVHCWRHSLAVAQLCEHLCTVGANPDVGTAYLVGLCHDLGELLFREQFGPEYRTVIECQKRTGQPRADIEREILGLPHTELVQIILQHFGLPAAIRSPIEQFHGPVSGGDLPLAKILRLADAYADGLMLAASPSAPIQSFTKTQCRGATGADNPAPPDTLSFCCQIVALTGMLAKLGRNEERSLNQPMFPKTAAHIWLARDPSLSEFDPTYTLLEALAEVKLSDRLPTAEESARMGGVVVTARTNTTAGFTQSDLMRVLGAAAGRTLPLLWIAPSEKTPMPPKDNGPQPQWPAPLADIAAFVQRAAGVSDELKAA